MGHFIPTIAAFLQTAYGGYIFQDACKGGQDQLASTLIFLFSIFLILYKANIFPCALRENEHIFSLFLQYLVTQYIMETVMNDFWYPLESSLFIALPKLANFERKFWKKIGFSSFDFLQFFKYRIVIVLITYALSIFILFAVLRSGEGTANSDAYKRMRRKFKKMYMLLRKADSCEMLKKNADESKKACKITRRGKC